MRRSRTMLTVAFALTALLVVVLPHGARAAPRAPLPTPSGVGSTAAGSPGREGLSAVCTLPGLVPAGGSGCPANQPDRRQLLGLPNPVHVIQKVAGGAATTAIRTVALSVIVGWVASGAESALKDTAKVIDRTTRPELTSSWFSASYWRIAGIAALLTLPFLCAAAIHALVRSDLGLLTRAAFGYLPLSLLAVGIASQLTMLLLSGTDEMSSIVAAASGHADGVFLARTSVAAIVASVGTGDPFVAFIAAIATVAAALALWVELLIRDAAVYVIVLMLPLFFAAMVWPARRVLAIRAIETLIALILSKFAIVAVLALGGTALGHSTIPGPAAVLTGATLVLLAAFSPWALLRVLPLHEVASAAAGGLSQGARQHAGTATGTAMTFADGAVAMGADGGDWLRSRRLSDSWSSSLDGGRFRDAHRSAAIGGAESGRSGSTGGAGPGDPGGNDLAAPIAGGTTGASEPVTEAMGGGARPVTEAMGGGARPVTEAAGGGAGPVLGAIAGTGTGVGRPTGGGGAAEDAPAAADNRGDGERAGDGEPSAADRVRPARGAGPVTPGPDGDTFPFVLHPDAPPLVLDEELGALVGQGSAGVGDDGPWPATPEAANGTEPHDVDPPVLADHDPVGPPPAAPPPDRRSSPAQDGPDA